ncbi:NAD(P)-dependent oxidoreductase [Caulobacter sp. Root1472]|uniref:NAD(P)-dependent oxidoreductase n=1 Tax=Caulobacter sp. Root1472 TaxID=1736470 RepID=UPI0006FEF7DF|nr:NAD(P)-dependent oxidoreductase [Caulobacter sp. Root1472]KQZ31684.1 oxidoreductase [Caulobacter sp. Root1472]
MHIGFIGLGAMGKAMVETLLEKGHAVTVWNRSPGPAAELAARGAKVAAAIDDALQADIVLSILAHDQAIRDVLLEALPRARQGLVHVNLATISTAFARELADRHAALGLGYVAAPVFGRPPVARAGGLNVLAAGTPDAVAAAMPALEALAAKVWPMGEDPVRANAVKIAGNLMIVAAVEAMGEATALGAAHGVPAGDLLDVLTSTIFAAPVYKIYGAMIAEGRYHPPGFAADLALKDVRLAQAAGDEKGLALPLADLVESGLEALLAGEGETPDLAGLAEVSRGRVEGR